MKKADVRIGMQVTTTEPVEAYYSGACGRPKQQFRPGMVGTVAAVDVPRVRRRGSFVCVDFVGDDGDQWRAGVGYECINPYDESVRNIIALRLSINALPQQF
ncbi:MAG: hypothetical protein MN733_36275 [Nitrososphaera sp.]|nr:hypothetical protein [Nitrososphaera sp.]